MMIILGDKLLEKEVLFRDDLELIFGKSKFEEELKEENKISKKKESPKEEEEEEVKETVAEKIVVENPKTTDSSEEKS